MLGVCSWLSYAQKAREGAKNKQVNRQICLQMLKKNMATNEEKKIFQKCQKKKTTWDGFRVQLG